MAQSINQRIVLSGADEVRRHLEEIGKAGERAGNQTRAALVAATQGATGFTTATRSAGVSSGQMRFALQNLGFQINDVATSLASGSDPMRVFAQQGGQIIQVFTQGGGLSNVLSAAGSAIRSMITPMRLATAGALGLTAAIGALAARGFSAQDAARQFDAQLKGLGKSGKTTGADLEQAAHRLRDVGLSFSEAQKQIFAGIAQGADPAKIERIVRIGANLNRVLGEGSLERFVAAAAKGGEPLAEFARQLGIIPRVASGAASQVQNAGGVISRTNQSIYDAVRDRNRSIADEERNAGQQIADLTRHKGNAQEEIQRASRLRIEDINRQSARRINDLIAQENAENAKKLKEYNDKILNDAQQALGGGDGVLDQIEKKVQGLDAAALGPATQATRNLGIAWDNMLTSLSRTDPIKNTVRELTDLFNWASQAAGALNAVNAAKQGSAPPAATAPIPPVSYAAGGLVVGPGSGTSDSILARVSNHEFINTAKAVQFWGVDFFRSLNNFRLPAFAAGGLVSEMMAGMNQPMIPRTRLATGGLVMAGAGGGGTPVHLHIGNGSFALHADSGVVEPLLRAAKRAQITSGGRKPGWKS